MTVDGVCDLDSRAARGVALLADNRFGEALVELRLAVTGGDASAVTLLNLAIAEDRAGTVDRAQQIMRDLAWRIPQWDEPPLRLAESLRAKGDMRAAEQVYKQVLEINPDRPEALIALSGLLLLRGEAKAAQPLLLRCCGVQPNRAEAWSTLGIALMQSGDPALAHTAFIKAHKLAPTTLDYGLHRVEAAVQSDRAEADLATLELQAESDPLNPTLYVAAGVLLRHLTRHAEAVEHFEAAVALMPDDRLPAGLLASALGCTTRLREAEAAFRRAVELDPNNPQLLNDYGATLLRTQRHAEARAVLQSAIDEHGDDAQVLSNLANATCCLGLQSEAVALARQAVELAPQALMAHRTLVSTLAYNTRTSGAELLSAAKECSDCLPRAQLPAFANDATPDRRLTIGLLSGTLKTHPVGWLTIAGFESLDPANFSIVALAHQTWGDPIARRFRAVAREWHQIETLSDEAVARKARELGIDIAIDLGGYGEASRMPACAYRLAPVQIKWVGMQSHTTGMPEMDWMLTDRWETPSELSHLYTERLLYMPDGYACYSPPPYAPDVAPLPALAKGHITFGCFNNLAKVTPQVIDTWCRILHRVPGARLVLKTHQAADPTTAQRVRDAFAALGVTPDQLGLRGPSGHRAFVGEYNDIDIVLDPFPYSGGLTTCEALWMGVPTVTMPGEIFASRHSVSHLSNAGLADWVAPDVTAYIELAVRKAADIAALALLREGLRAQVKASPLCDAPRFGRNLGAALRFAWQDWCERAIATALRPNPA